MKKISILLIITVLLIAMAGSVCAKDIENIEYFEDGSYCISEITEEVIYNNSRAISTKTGSKTNKYYSSSGALQFSLKVTGTFNYNGTVARSTSSSYSKTIHDSTWSFVSGSSSYSANYATATGTFRNATTKTISVTLYCDQDGNLS